MERLVVKQYLQNANFLLQIAKPNARKESNGKLTQKIFFEPSI